MGWSLGLSEVSTQSKLICERAARVSCPYQIKTQLPLLSNEGAVGGLAPELINIDNVFANAGDGDF